MKKILPIVGLLLVWLVTVNFLGCTNSKPIRPDEYSPIYCSIDSLFFTFPTQTMDFSMKYVGGSGTLAWYISSKPDWVLLQPVSGYLTYDYQGIEATIDQTVLYKMSYGTYRGTIVFYSSEGIKNLNTIFVYKN